MKLWQYHNFHNFFHNFHNSKAYILESYWRYHTRGSVWIDDDGSHCNSYKWPTLKNSFATEKTLALISEIFWNSELFFILYCTVMSKIFILNLHMLVMHRLCHRYRKGIKLFCAISWYKRNLFAAFHPCAKRKCGNSNPQKS